MSGLKFTEFGARFHMKNLLKHNQPGEPLSSIKVYDFKEDRRICPVRCLKEYVNRTRKLRHGEDQLLISTSKPHERIAWGVIVD